MQTMTYTCGLGELLQYAVVFVQYEGCGPSLHLGDDVTEPSDHVRLLGVSIAADLGLDRHVSNVCSTCFFWIRQLRRVRRLLESIKTLVHAFVTSCVDYCNSVLYFALKKVMDKLQYVQNTAARKYERGLSQLMHDDLHWLVIPQRVQYKLAVTVHRCLQHQAPRYLADYCVPVSDVSGRQHLRSARCHQLSVPRVRRSTLRTRAFSVAGPTMWNSLPDHLRDPAVDSEQCTQDLKTYLFAGHS